MLDKNFVISPDSIGVNQVILVRSARAAEILLAEFFPHYTDCVIASADGVYPLDPDLNRETFACLREKGTLAVVVINFESLKNLKLRTERILVLDDLIIGDFTVDPDSKAVCLEVGHERLGFLVHSFFSQWLKIERIENPTFHYKNSNTYSPSRFNWLANVLIG